MVCTMMMLLPQLEHLQHLTHLSLQHAIDVSPNHGSPPAGAFAAVTASSKLQHLDLSRCSLPAGVWRHLFAPGKQLPHLKYLNASRVI